MNNERRRRIEEIVSRLDDLKNDLENILDDEQTAFDSIPESLQQTERAESSQTAIDEMTDVISTIETIVDQLTEITQ